MNDLRAMTPKQRKYARVEDARHALQIFSSRAFLTRFGAAAVPVAGVGIYRVVSGHSLAVAFLGAIIALGVATAAIQSWLRGFADTNTGIFLRESEPVRFWAIMLLLCAGYLFALLFTIYADD